MIGGFLTPASFDISYAQGQRKTLQSLPSLRALCFCLVLFAVSASAVLHDGERRQESVEDSVNLWPAQPTSMCWQDAYVWPGSLWSSSW